jgi:Ca2+-binding EF-hand superfamily protein
MSASLLERKIRRCFDHLDVNRDGQIQAGDLMALASRLMSNFGVVPDSPKGRQLVSTFEDWWTKLVVAMDTSGDAQISPAEFEKGMIAAWITDGQGYEQFFHPAADAIVALSDTDGDGIVTRYEFQRFQEAFGTPPEKIDEAFEHLDADDDGFLSREEILRAFHEYYTTDSADNPGNLLYGSI